MGFGTSWLVHVAVHANQKTTSRIRRNPQRWWKMMKDDYCLWTSSQKDSTGLMISSENSTCWLLFVRPLMRLICESDEHFLDPYCCLWFFSPEQSGDLEIARARWHVAAGAGAMALQETCKKQTLSRAVMSHVDRDVGPKRIIDPCWMSKVNMDLGRASGELHNACLFVS